MTLFSGIALAFSCETEQACKHLREALRLDPDHRDACRCGCTPLAEASCSGFAGADSNEKGMPALSAMSYIYSSIKG